MSHVTHTVLPVYGNLPGMNSGQFSTFICQKLNNASLLLNRRILQHEHNPVYTPCLLDSTLYQSLWSFLRMPLPVRSPIHNEDSNRIPSNLYKTFFKYENYNECFLQPYSFRHIISKKKGCHLWKYLSELCHIRPKTFSFPKSLVIDNADNFESSNACTKKVEWSDIRIQK